MVTACVRRSRSLAGILATILVAGHRWAAGIELQPIAGTYDRPVYVTSAKDGRDRLFIVEQPGIIRVLQPGAASPTVFLNITNRVNSTGNEQGLLGLAFHPRFAINRRFFVNYTRSSDGATVVAQYRASTTNVNVASTQETILLTVAQPFANHNGGMIEFGPDGFLYVFMGDGGSANDPDARAQNIDDLLGKILRINVDQSSGGQGYSSPPDNPFFGATAGRDEIFSLGFRNPWRGAFDRGTGALFVGDVGQEALEEADIVELGGNYGWRVFEGSECTGNDPNLCDPNDFLFPIVEYDHGQPEVRCAITGGYVYRGARSALPVGAYAYGDYCAGEVYTLDPPVAGTTPNLELDSDLLISSFGEDEAGELYVVDLNGTVSRITASPPPAPCAYSITPTNRNFTASGGTNSFTLTTSSDCAWIVRSHQAWLTITSASNGVGNATINFTVATNATGRIRRGTITVAGETFSVRQSP